MFYCIFSGTLSHYISKLPWLIAVKISHVIGNVCTQTMSVPKLGAYSKTVFWATAFFAFRPEISELTRSITVKLPNDGKYVEL